MVNAEYMKVLAQLESAACTQKEKDAINMVRGRYVQQFGTDNEYVNALGMLEAAAATQKEKDDVNMIRGKYGLFEMTGGLTEGVAYDEKGTLVDDDVDVPEVADTSDEDDKYPLYSGCRKTIEEEGLSNREKMCRRIAQDTGYPIDVVREICWEVINNNWPQSEEDAKRYGKNLREYYTQSQVDKSID